MIGHTGNYDAVVKSLEFLDGCVKKVVDCAKQHNNFVLLCADHGNAECMRDENGVPQTAHTLNPVKCVIIDENKSNKTETEKIFFLVMRALKIYCLTYLFVVYENTKFPYFKVS